jgi:hypothetical protein
MKQGSNVYLVKRQNVIEKVKVVDDIVYRNNGLFESRNFHAKRFRELMEKCKTVNSASSIAKSARKVPYGAINLLRW